MDLLSREREVKLELLSSLARSQRAMARILESVADVTACSSDSARALQQELRTMTRLQQAIASSIVPLRISKVQRGKPGRLWLRDGKLALEAEPVFGVLVQGNKHA
ncbi:hypothetical protein [Paenibacillus daejeonensis]|uniref:hypothetical protein n=1 Tax=Paenibacillus daejeonensis TaxID=135193 RepID=UPI00035D7C0A|nr:hypothetical protein [Paenibacillus daejeonensis]